MKTQDSPFWVTITMESEEAESKVQRAIAACNKVHDWTIGMLTTQWLIDSGYRVKTSDLMPELTPLLTVHHIKDSAQRFSYMTTVSRAIARFYQELVVDAVGTSGAEVIFPPHPPPPPYRLLDIQSRTVWRRYMTNHHRISTHYGSLFLEGGWIKTILDQSLELHILPSTVPFLIYSATLRQRGVEGRGEKIWQVHFNFHKPDSQQGKARVKQSWQWQTE